MSAGDDENVVGIGVRKKRVDPDRTIESVRVGVCSHPRFLVDERLNEVECQVCHERLSPMWVLRQIANNESWQAQRRDNLRNLIRQLAEKVRYKCRSCGAMNDMARIVKVRRTTPGD